MMRAEDEGRGKEFIAELFQQYYKKLMVFVSKNPMFYTMAEDIVQDTFFEAVRNCEKLMKHENPGGWLMETAKFKMRDLRRKMNTRSFYETGEVELELESLENQYGIVEINMILDSALNIHEKTLFHMFYLEGYSVRELSEMEGITEVNFRVRMLRIRAKVQKELERKK